MNVPVIRLAIRTAFLLQSNAGQNSITPSASHILKYFRKTGLPAAEIESMIGQPPGKKHQKISEALYKEEALCMKDDICNEINSTLTYDEKVFLLLITQDCLMHLSDMSQYQEQLIDMFKHMGIDIALSDKFKDFLTIDNIEDLASEDFLILSPLNESTDEKLEGSWIEDNAPRNKIAANLLEIDKVYDHLIIMFVDQIKSFLIRYLNASVNQFDQTDNLKCRFKIISPGSELLLEKGSILTYSQIKKQYLQLHPKGSVSLIANDVEFKSSRGTKEVRRFSTSEISGQIIGIVGKEGVGKTTLLKLMAGQLKPDSGRIIINGYDLWRYKYLLKGIIGYVPEEDLLIEELTVFENLTLTARLHYSDLTKREIEKKVDALLARLDLTELKHEVVGDIFSKHIQPGQRRMLNIALELLREPHILLVDNALYGLSMADAAKVIKILHDYTFGGNLVITTISQAGRNAFDYFDKIWIIDEGGRMVYNGSIRNATAYLYKQLNLVHRNVQDVDPSVLLDLINYKLPDPETNSWKRVIEPQKWHELHIEERKPIPPEKQEKTLLPARILKIPNLEIQLLIFSIRNFKSKFSRIQDIVNTFLSGPLIAVAIAFLMRMQTDGGYTFSSNDNLPLFLFISVVTAIVMGVIASADEFIKERNILKKEEYLEFSRFSYINSKILYLFPLLAVQLFLYVITSNWILEIRDMIWYYWIVLFSAGCFGVLTGLFLSMSVKHINDMYKKLIPVVLALQIILGGGIIPYENMNLGKGKFSPILGDLMVSRWGYEALAVTQYKNNRYESLFFDAEKKLSQANFYSTKIVPALEEMLDRCTLSDIPADSIDFYCAMLFNEMTKIAELEDIFPFEYLDNIADLKEDESIRQEVRDYLTYLSMYFYNEYNRMNQEKEDLLAHLEDSLGTGGLQQLRHVSYNEKLEETVRRMDQDQPFYFLNTEIVPQIDPIFMNPESDFGRAGFFSSTKIINGQFTNTIWFNMAIIWLLTFLVYLLLLFNATDFVRKLLRLDPL